MIGGGAKITSSSKGAQLLQKSNLALMKLMRDLSDKDQRILHFQRTFQKARDLPKSAGPSKKRTGPSKRRTGPSKRRTGPSKKRTGPSKKRTESNFFHDFQGGGGPNRIFPLNSLLRGVQFIISDRVVPEV